MFRVCCVLPGASQSRRLALASCCHPRLGVDALLVDFDMMVKIGQLVVAARTERIHLALLEPEQWSVSVCDVADGQGGIAEGIPPSS